MEGMLSRILKQRPGLKAGSDFNKSILLYASLVLVTLSLAQSTSGDYGPSMLSLLQPIRVSSSSPGPLPFLVKKSHPPPIRQPEKRILHLEDFPNYATVLPLTEGRSWIRSEEIIQILGQESLNKAVPFIVVPPPGHGMMVVIQELQIPAHNTFNRSLVVIDENGMIMECFSKFLFQIEGKRPVQVCGKTNDRERFRPSLIDGVGPRSFIVPPGKSISVNFIFRDEEIDRKGSVSRQVPFYDVGYLFRASIAFTGYRSCPHGPPYHDELSFKLWPCDIPQSSREPVASCVREDVFCDQVINCGIHNTHEFGVDERFCKKSGGGDPPPLNMSHRQRPSTLSHTHLEEAIHSRIITSDLPFTPNDNPSPEFGAHSSPHHHPHHQSTRPRPELGGDYNYPTENLETDVTHPAFVTLVILISIICVLLLGFLFRYLFKRCLGKSSDPFADSSNPEALQRFHENLRTRDNDGIGRPPSGYGLSTDTLFKPSLSEDLPPSYEDLFPHEISKSLDDSHFPHQSFPPPPLEHSSSSSNNILLLRAIPTRRLDYPQPSSIYTIPVIQQRPSSSSLQFDEPHPLRNNPSQLLRVQVLSGSGPSSAQPQAEVRDEGGGGGGGVSRGNIVTVNNNNNNSSSSSSNHNDNDYPDQHRNIVHSNDSDNRV